MPTGVIFDCSPRLVSHEPAHQTTKPCHHHPFIASPRDDPRRVIKPTARLHKRLLWVRPPRQVGGGPANLQRPCFRAGRPQGLRISTAADGAATCFLRIMMVLRLTSFACTSLSLGKPLRLRLVAIRDFMEGPLPPSRNILGIRCLFAASWLDSCVF